MRVVPRHHDGNDDHDNDDVGNVFEEWFYRAEDLHQRYQERKAIKQGCCPSTVLATDELEWTPLHAAAIHSQSLEKIDALLSPFPEVIMMLTRQGETATEISKHNKSDAIDVIRACPKSKEKKIKALPDFRNILKAYTRNFNKSSLTESINFCLSSF